MTGPSSPRDRPPARYQAQTVRWLPYTVGITVQHFTPVGPGGLVHRRLPACGFPSVIVRTARIWPDRGKLQGFDGLSMPDSGTAREKVSWPPFFPPVGEIDGRL